MRGGLYGRSSGFSNGGSCEQPGGIKRGQGRNFIVQDKGEFSAPQDDSVAFLFGLHSLYDGEEIREIFLGHPVKNETVENYRVDLISLLEVWRDGVYSNGHKLIPVDWALHQVFGSKDRESFEIL